MIPKGFHQLYYFKGALMFYKIKFLKVFCILISVLSLTACAKGFIEPRHNPSKQVEVDPKKDPIVYPEKEFTEYINKTRTYIKNAITNTTYEKLEDQWIEARLPFEYQPKKEAPCNSEHYKSTKKPYKYGALLIHGLTDTPFIMQDLGKAFRDKCFLVRSILLPGHGTVPGDLLNINYLQWIKSIDAGIEGLDTKVENLYLVGFSTGTSLSLHHVLRKNNPDHIKGLILLSPGIKEKTRAGLFANWHKIISWLLPKAKWINLHPDQDKVKYESFAFNAGDQFHLLTKDLRRLAKKTSVEIPVYMTVSSVDATVESNIARDFFCKNIKKNVKKRMVWYTSEKVNNLNGTCEIEEVDISNDSEGILDYAHLSLPVSPENAYYGKNGAYKSCLTYSKSNFPKDQEDEELHQCKTKTIGKNSRVKFGEHIDKNKEKYIVRRLTFNPNFENMMKDIFKFIVTL